jgi:hypothetical protein
MTTRQFETRGDEQWDKVRAMSDEELREDCLRRGTTPEEVARGFRDILLGAVDQYYRENPGQK